MVPDIEEMLRIDFEEMSDSDRIVLLISGEAPVSKSRLQKTSLIFVEMYGGGARFSEGYSDEIDESAEKLSDIGILRESAHGYSLTEYGGRLRDHTASALRASGEGGRIDGLANIMSAISEIPDRQVVGLTYRFYAGVATNPSIRESVGLLNAKTSYGGVMLSDYPESEFEGALRSGRKLRLDQGAA